MAVFQAFMELTKSTENCGASGNTDTPAVVVQKKTSESTSDLANRFKALLRRPRTSAKTLSANAPPTLTNRFKALLSRPRTSAKTLSANAPPKAGAETSTTAESSSKALPSRPCESAKTVNATTPPTADPKISTVPQSETNSKAELSHPCISAKSTAPPTAGTTTSIVAQPESGCMAAAKPTATVTTIPVSPPVETVAPATVKSQIPAVPVASEVDAPSIYIYTKQYVDEKVKPSVDEFSKVFREEDETLKAQMALMQHTIKEIEAEAKQMLEHDREVEAIISGFEQATQEISSQKNTEIKTLKAEIDHLEERQYELAESLKFALLEEKKVAGECAAAQAKADEALEQMRVKYKSESLELQTACEKIQKERAACDAKFVTTQKRVDDVESECAVIIASTNQLRADLKAEKIESQRANKTLAKTKEQAQKQLDNAKALVDSKQAELVLLKGQVGDMQKCIADFQKQHREAEASIAACAAEQKLIAECMEREEADKKQAVLKAFDLKQEVETIKAQIAKEKTKAAEQMQVCQMLMEQAEDP